MSKYRDFISESVTKTWELITDERIKKPKEPLYIMGKISAESEVPHGTDSDYIMRLDLDSNGKKLSVKGPVMLPNDDEETRDGSAYACKRIAGELANLRIMNTIFKISQISLYNFEIRDKE